MQLAKSANITAQACPVALTCEYQVNPLGIDTVAPRLSWRMESSARGARQTAYQVLVASSEQALAADQGDLWDSGRVESDQSVQIAYFGKALTSRMQCYWKVRVWDTDGNANAFSAPAFWEMGLLTETDWQAQWIGKTLGRPATMAPAVPAPYFRKEIAVPRQPVAARAYVSGLGYFELSVNGKKVGDHVLDPIFTSYDKRALYVTHDLTPYITQGDNAIGIVLGNGWYNSHTHDVWHFETAPWRDCPKVIAQIYLDYADGTSEIIVTDSSWQVSTGPIVFDGVRNGETYDARLEQPGWDTPHFDAQDWENACIICSPGGTLVAQQQPPTKVMQTITPVSVTEVKPGVFLFDMGQNIAGWGQLTVSGPAGTQVVMKYAEKIGEDGDIDPKNIDKFISTGEFQTDTYILKGDGVEVWEPHFTFHGFRYAQMTGFPGTPTVENLRGRVVYTSFDTIGSFACSNQLLNDLQRCTQWSFIGNFVGYPTDCPHREKNGWTGDAQIAVETGLYNYTPAAAYARWMFDFDDAQRPNGELPGIIPTPGWGYNWGNGPAWDSAFLIIPWNVYQYCGDTRILADHYAGMKRYMTFMESMATDDMLSFGLGDWCPPKGNNYVKTPVLFTSTGYYYANSRMMAAIADLLGKQDDAVYFTKLAEKIKTAFTRTYIDPASGKCLVSEQTAVSCILYQGLDDAANHDVLVAQLAETVKNADYHIDCGILGAKYLLHALSNNGYADLAYRIVAQKSYPSWGHWLEQGATTLWESWEGGSSRNHIMFGDISAWFYAALAGIKPAAPGFKQIIIHPHPVFDLTKAEGEYLSAYGRIRSAWEIVDGRFSLEVAVPANTSATVYVPADDVKKITENGAEAASSAGITFQCMKDGCAVFAVEPGTYHFIAE